MFRHIRTYLLIYLPPVYLLTYFLFTYSVTYLLKFNGHSILSHGRPWQNHTVGFWRYYYTLFTGDAF